MKKFRIGMIRCDTHSYWYGAFMAKCDIALLQKNSVAVHDYFCRFNELAISLVPGLEIVRVWDYDSATAQKFSETFLGKPQVCETVEEMTDGIDAVFIADSTGDGSDHLELASPFLKKGIPAFVDKPFASRFKDAKAMVRLAKKNDVPLMSASLLQGYTDTAIEFRRRFKEIGPIQLAVKKEIEFRRRFRETSPIRLAVVKGLTSLAGVIHGISMVQGFFGDGVEWVECMGSLPLEFLLLHYKNGLQAIVMSPSNESFHYTCSFHCSVYSRFGKIHNRGVLHMPPIGDFEFPTGTRRIVLQFKQMLKIRKPPIPYEFLLELIAIMDAGRMAQQKGRRIYLKDVK